MAETSPRGSCPWCDKRRAKAMPKPENKANSTPSTLVKMANVPWAWVDRRAVMAVMPSTAATPSKRVTRLISVPLATPSGLTPGPLAPFGPAEPVDACWRWLGSTV